MGGGHGVRVRGGSIRVSKGDARMPWSENAHMSRSRFVADFESCLYTMTELCERHGISRKTGYKWAERYGSQGAEGLKDRSRAPNHRPTQTPAEVADRLVELRRKHPTWGPRKLAAWLKKHEPEQAWPAASTIGGVLKREGLVTASRRRSSPHSRPCRPRPSPILILLYRVPRGEFPAGGRRLPSGSNRGKEVMRMPSLGSIAATLLVAGLCGPALAPAAMAAELPAFRPGLWEFKRTVEGGRGPQTLANQKCTNPTEDMKKGRQSLAGVGCTFTPLTQSG